MLETLAIIAVIGVAAVWGLAAWGLRGEDLSPFDTPTGERFASAAPSAELAAVLAHVATEMAPVLATPLRRRIAVLRREFERLFAGRSFAARFVPADAGGVRAEWVLAPGADPARRLLYIHGGAFVFGSPATHRTLTTRLSALTGGAVLAIDYRLMPEHPRIAGIEDCRSAYRWLLANGPQGAAPADAVFVAGDSAGGNLTLTLVAWVRDTGLRAPDAAVALSPATDATLASPSLRANVATDVFLGPMLGRLARIPHALLLWLGWLVTRINPRDPIVSPVYGTLAGLPPVLVQVSECEMLHDEGRRYVNRARAAGSPATLQTWTHMPHVWQIFNPELPEAEAALAEIGRFLDAAAPRRQPAHAGSSDALVA